MTVIELLRSRVHSAVEPVGAQSEWAVATRRAGEILADWVMEGLRSRLIIGYFRYERHGGGAKPGVNEAAIVAKLRAYGKTHNTECMMDIANIALLELHNPGHEDAHFTPTDPGRPGMD